MFGSKADQCFLEDAARFASACKLVLHTHGADQTKILVDVGTEPNATLDPASLKFLQQKASFLPDTGPCFFIHRNGRRDERLEESVMLVERFIQFLQTATGKDKGSNKLRVELLSCGGHDSDCVVKAIYDKPNSMHDLVSSKQYHMLGGNASHKAAYSLPWTVMGQEGFFCDACDAKERFCQLEQSVYDESERASRR